jgi:predicted alpha/beta superfamily hydrolase
MKRVILNCLLAIIPALLFNVPGVYGQNAQVINDSIYSKILNEERAIKVILPDGYKPGTSEKFEVIYLTDGEWVLEFFPYIYKFAKNENYVPPVIFVDIPNKYINKASQRDRDFLPVHVENPSISGGADKFIGFLKEELIPYIDKTYPTNGTNSLYGHSYGGLFVMYTLLTEPQLFQTYYATDPSFWWNNNYAINLASEKLGDVPPGKLLWIAGIDETYKWMGIALMDSVLKAKAPVSLRWKMATFPNEKHNSVKLKGIYDGIKYSYSGYSSSGIQFHPMNGIVLKDKPATIFLTDQYPDLRYTLNGSEPDKTSEKAEQKIILNGPAQLVLKSFSTSGKYDFTAKGSFLPGETMPSISRPKNVIKGGLRYSQYSGTWDKMPDLKKMKPVQTGIADSLFSFQNLPLKAGFACSYEGYLEITDDGYYIFATSANNGVRLYLGNKLIIDANELSTTEKINSFLIPLQKGFYPIRIDYFQKETTPIMNLLYLKPGSESPVRVPEKLLYH